MKRTLIFSVLLILMFSLLGCGTTGKKTSNDRELSESFTRIYNLLNLTEDFYYQSKEIILSNDEELTDEQKRNIMRDATTYKNLQKASSDFLLAWYNQVASDEEVTYKGPAVEALYSLLDKGESLSSLVEDYTDGKVVLPERLLKNINEILKIISKVEDKEEV